MQARDSKNTACHGAWYSNTGALPREGLEQDSFHRKWKHDSSRRDTLLVCVSVIVTALYRRYRAVTDFATTLRSARTTASSCVWLFEPVPTVAPVPASLKYTAGEGSSVYRVQPRLRIYVFTRHSHRNTHSIMREFRC